MYPHIILYVEHEHIHEHKLLAEKWIMEIKLKKMKMVNEWIN